MTPSTVCQVLTPGGAGLGCEWVLLAQMPPQAVLARAAGHTGAVPGTGPPSRPEERASCGWRARGVIWDGVRDKYSAPHRRLSNHTRPSALRERISPRAAPGKGILSPRLRLPRAGLSDWEGPSRHRLGGEGARQGGPRFSGKARKGREPQELLLDSRSTCSAHPADGDPRSRALQGKGLAGRRRTGGSRLSVLQAGRAPYRIWCPVPVT